MMGGTQGMMGGTKGMMGVLVQEQGQRTPP